MDRFNGCGTPKASSDYDIIVAKERTIQTQLERTKETLYTQDKLIEELSIKAVGVTKQRPTNESCCDQSESDVRPDSSPVQEELMLLEAKIARNNQRLSQLIQDLDLSF